jgi:hypothetical protein
MVAFHRPKDAAKGLKIVGGNTVLRQRNQGTFGAGNVGIKRSKMLKPFTGIANRVTSVRRTLSGKVYIVMRTDTEGDSGALRCRCVVCAGVEHQSE